MYEKSPFPLWSGYKAINTICDISISHRETWLGLFYSPFLSCFDQQLPASGDDESHYPIILPG